MPETTRRIDDIISAGEKVSDVPRLARLQGKYFGSVSFVLKFVLVMTPGASELVAALHFFASRLSNVFVLPEARCIRVTPWPPALRHARLV